jgi:3-oxoacyl-[acyl-carrier-protein] synthase-3
MGTVIEAVASARPGRREQPSSTLLAVEAARRALRQRSQPPAGVGLLVNAGVYRDGSVMEPANATFMQRLLGANLDVGSAAGRGTLSFDLANGACGVVSALQVVDGFLGTGSVERALVVSSDVDPTPGRSQGYRYAPVGAALLLGPGGQDEGFEAFGLRSYPQYADLADGSLTWADGSHRLHLREDPAYRGRCLDCAQDALGRFLDERGLAADDVDLLVGWPLAGGDTDRLARGLGIDPGRVADAGLPAHAAHTAGISVALESALTTQRYARARRVLLFAVGAGISVAMALYRKPPG